MTYQFLTYPLDVIKTNRIVQSSLAKEGVESVPREFMALYDKGGLQLGAMRGFSMGLLLAASEQYAPMQSLFVSVPLLTAIQQPLNAIQVHKQVVQGSAAAPSYAAIATQLNVKMFTLGVVPTFARNLVLLSALQPSRQGIADDVSSVVLALGAIAVSHPFEVARVHLQYFEKSSALGDAAHVLKTMYAKDGVAGVYRGLIPRTIQMAPAYMGLIFYNSQRKGADVQEFFTPSPAATA